MEEKVKVSFCPNCKSLNVRYTFAIRNLFGVIPKQICFDCKFSAPSFPILVVDRKEIKKGNKSLKDKK